MQQDSNFSLFLFQVHSNLTNLSPDSKPHLVSQILDFLSNNLIINPIADFIDSNILPELFALKGCETDHEIIDLIYLLLNSASKSSLKLLIEKNTIPFVCSFIPHRKNKIMAKIAFILGTFAGVSVNIREEILKSGVVGLLIRILEKHNNLNCALAVSFLVYKCSFGVNAGVLSCFGPCLQFAREGIKRGEGVLLANCYETFHNVAQEKANHLFIKSFVGIETEFLSSFGRWSGSLRENNFLSNEENLLVCFLHLLTDFVQIFDEQTLIKSGMAKAVFERLFSYLFADGTVPQKLLLTLFYEIYQKELPFDYYVFFIQIKGMLKWIEKTLLNDRKEKFCLCLNILQKTFGFCGAKINSKINKHSKILKSLVTVYENLVSIEKRIQILNIFHGFVVSINKEIQNGNIFTAENNEFYFEINRICRIFREDAEEAEILRKLRLMAKDYLKNVGYLLESDISNMKLF